MLSLVFGFGFGSSPNPSVGYNSSNSGMSSPVMGEVEVAVAVYLSPKDLSSQLLPQIVEMRETATAIQRAADSLRLNPAAQMHSLRVVNALLKRIICFYPTSENYIVRESHKPKSGGPGGMIGPTPEILLEAIHAYVPVDLQGLYYSFVETFFPEQMQQFLTLLAKAEEEAYFLATINRWIDDVQQKRRSLPKTRKTRLVTPNQLSQWMKSGMRKPNKPWRS